MKSIISVLLGLLIAWTILTFIVPRPNVSTYVRIIDPAPLTMDDTNLAMIGTGLASPQPKPSVMDAPSPAALTKNVMMMMGSSAPAPMMKMPVKMMAPGTAPMVMMAPGAPPPPMMVAPAPSSALPMSSTMTPVASMQQAPSPSV